MSKISKFVYSSQNNNSSVEVNNSNKEEVYENQVIPIVNSIVTDLIESIVRRESVMSEEIVENMSICETRSEFSGTPSPKRLDQTIDEINESYSTPLSSSNVEDSPQKELSRSCSSIDGSPAYDKPEEEEEEEEFELRNANHQNELLNEVNGNKCDA